MSFNELDVIRTDTQVDELIRLMSEELENLPDQDAFGGSNATAKRELDSDIRILKEWREKRQLPHDEWDNILGWFVGASWSSVGVDYDLKE